MRGFAGLTERARIEVEPERLQIIATSGSASLREILLAEGVDQERLEEHSLLNGMLLEDRVETGRLLVLVRPGGR